MEISPAVPAPRAGDPITAKWAADLAAAVNSAANPADSVGAVSSPFGKASPAPGLPMLGTAKMPQPFDVALFRDEGESTDTLYIWLPDLSADYVLYAGQPVPPAPGQTIGGNSTAWVEIGAVANGAAHYIYLVPHLDSNDEIDGWEISDSATAWNPSGGGTGDELPHVLLAYYNIAADSTVPSPGDDNYFPSGQNGLVQCRHGTIEFGAGDVQTDCDVTPGAGEYAPGQSVDTWEGQSGTPVTPPPIELRAFWNTADVEATQGIGETGSDTEPDALQVLFRKKAPGSSPSQRPKLVYVEAEDGPFWVKGADHTQNWGESINLGTPALGFITISVTQ